MTRTLYAPIRSVFVVALGSLGFAPAVRQSTPTRAAALHVEEVGSDSTTWDVIATMISGPTEMIVWDAMARQPDGVRLAERVAATGKKLKAIAISHPDHDHYMGVAALLARFPGTPVYMSAAGIEEFKKTSPRALQMQKTHDAVGAPDSLVTPVPFPRNTLTVDGEIIQIIYDLTGDSGLPINTALWIPSLQTVLVGDLAFNGVHPWLGASTEASRKAWVASIDKVLAMHPKIVVPGHKKDVTATDSPAVFDFMKHYLGDFEALKKTSSNGNQLFAAMMAKYPDLAAPGLLRYASGREFRSASGGS